MQLPPYTDKTIGGPPPMIWTTQPEIIGGPPAMMGTTQPEIIGGPPPMIWTTQPEFMGPPPPMMGPSQPEFMGAHYPKVVTNQPGSMGPPPPMIGTTQQVLMVEAPPVYKDYLALSIINLLCCCLPFGIVALVFSVQTRDANDRGDSASASRHSRNAFTWNMVALGVGLPINAAWIGYVIYINVAYRTYYYG